MYHEYQVIPYVIETNHGDQGFQPSFARWRNITVNRVRPGWQLLFDKLDGPSIHGQVKDVNGSAVVGASLHIERTGGAAFVQDYPVQDNGFFDVILPIGTFQVTATATGYQPKIQSVTIVSTRAELPVNLEK